MLGEGKARAGCYRAKLGRLLKGKALEIAEAGQSPSKVDGLPAGPPVGMVLQLTSK